MDNMKVKEKLHSTQLLIMVAYLALQLVGAVIIAADDQAAPSPAPALTPKQLALPGCPSTCGGVEIPYPFGIGNSSAPGDNKKPCYLRPRFKLTCNHSKLYLGKIYQISHIDILRGQMDIMFGVSSSCNNSEPLPSPSLKFSWLSISNKKNKFITVGCNSYGYLYSDYNGNLYATGCLTRCYGHDPLVNDGTCSGIGCCQVDIPPRMRNITIQAYNFYDSSYNRITPLLGESCTYAFVVKQDNYVFCLNHLQQGGLPRQEYPMVVDWAVGNKSCSAATQSEITCGKHSQCNDTDTDIGYRCICDPGYEGNPYHPDGCIDIDECEMGIHTCISRENCINAIGNYYCFCPKGQSGDGTKEVGCHQRDVLSKVVIAIGVAIGVVVLSMGASSQFLIYQKRKLIKLKKKFFEQNGGLILLQRLSTREDSSQTAKIFTEDQLKKATNNYDESLIIGRGGFGIVFKGFLPGNKIVAIKRSKIIDASQIEQFINEVVVLLQINHRNVVKLLGCCLEAEVPLLVYEFVNNGTLFDFLHTEDKENNAAPWKIRLKIAAEVAEALSYLHSSVSIPIIHRDVKSANILLDVNYIAKVSDFGASRLVPLDQTEIATVVQGTIGYLDPEYMLTNQLNEKSDVYSFGVVLVELLTGEKPFPFVRPEEKRNLPMHFLSCLKNDRMFEVLQDGILNEENKQEIKEVAILAAKCLRLKGEERPSMKEVAVELEGMRSMEKHSWINTDVEETRYLLHETSSSSIYETGDSSGHGNTGYGSLKDNVQLIVLDDGR